MARFRFLFLTSQGKPAKLLLCSLVASIGLTLAVSSTAAASATVTRTTYVSPVPQTYVSGCAGQDVYLNAYTVIVSRDDGTSTVRGVWTYTAQPSGVSVTLNFASTFHDNPSSDNTFETGVLARIHVDSGLQVIDAGSAHFGPFVFHGRLDTPAIEIASYAPVCDAFRLAGLHP